MASVTKTYTNTSEQPNVTYKTTVKLTRVSATKIKISVSCDTRLGGPEDWLGTGHKLVGHIWFDGKDHTWTIKKSTSSWSGSAWHENSGNSWTIDAGPEVTSDSFQLKFVNTYDTAGDIGWQKSFSVDVDSGVSYATDDHSGVEITGEADSQANATVELSSIPSSVGYTRVICWYNGDEYVGYTPVTGTSHSTTFTGLMPNTTYKLTAKIMVGSIDGSVIATKTVSITTPQETGSLSLVPQSTYITAEISEMFNEPNYDRSIEVYVKRPDASAYTLATTVTSQSETASANIKNLISGAEYDVQVLIKNGSTTLKTLTGRTETLEDTSLIPTGILENVHQQLGTRNCYVYWDVDKLVAGTIYEIQAKPEGKAWETIATLDEVQEATMVTLEYGNVDVAFRVKTTNPSVAEDLANYSNIFYFYVRDDFLWDIEKVAGVSTITANEWNRLREYAIARNNALGNTVNIPVVRQGEAVTAQTYNTMKNAISLVTLIDVADKRRGDAITAADIDALRVAINTVAT